MIFFFNNNKHNRCLILRYLKILRYVGSTPLVFFFKFKNVQRDKYLNAQIPIVDKMFRRWIKQAY